MSHVRLTALRAALLACFSFVPLHTAAGLGQSTATAASPVPKDHISALLDTLRQVRRPETAAISQDGNYVAWTVEGPAGWELHLTGIAPPGAIQDAAWDRVLSPDTIGDVTNLRPGACPADHPAWSPDGKQLAFLSGCEFDSSKFRKTKQKNLFLWTLANNRIQQLTHLKGELSSLEWSPDGKSIAFLFVENATRRAGALDAMRHWNGVIGEDHIEVQQIARVDVTGQHFESSLVPYPNLHIYEFAWAPDSQRIAFVAAPPPGENNWWGAKLYIKDLGPLASCNSQGICIYNGPLIPDPVILVDPAQVASPLHGLQIAVPRFSADGKQIAFIGGLMSDQGSVGGDIYVAQTDDVYAVGLKGPSLRNITANRPASPAWLSWRDNRSLLITERASGKSHITAIDTTTGKDDSALNITLPDDIIAGKDVMDLSLAAHSPNIAVIRSSFDRPPEVWTGAISDLKQLTHLNDSIHPSWGKSESIEYTSEGFHVQGWLLYPADYDPAKRYPLIVSVHGGPSGAVIPHWPSATYGAVPFSALGYFVFLPNPRGSFGQGEKFTQANVKDFGYGDLRDILAGVDLLEKRFPIDKSREGITGWSYGGFMTMFAVTQTHRFKAAVAGAGISNWQSYYGENSIDQWMVPFFGATVYDDPAIYAKSSAINFVKEVRTPTLMVVGDRDGECPAPQSFEFWHALRALGIKTQLVIYPNEGHHFVDHEHQSDVLRRALEWFETYLPSQSK